MASDPYADIYRSGPGQEPPRQRPRGGLSAMEQAMQDERDDSLRIGIINGPAPEQVARAARVARDVGIEPALIADRVDETERAVNARKSLEVFGRYPAFGRWAASNPTGANSASDDHESLGMLGRAWEVLKGRKDQAVQYSGVVGWSQMNTVNNLADTLTYPLDAALATGLNMLHLPSFEPDKQRERIAAKRTQIFQASQAAMAAADERAQTGNYVIDTMGSGVATIIPSMVGIAMSVASRNPSAASTFMGLSAAAPAYCEASPRKASAYGASL